MVDADRTLNVGCAHATHRLLGLAWRDPASPLNAGASVDTIPSPIYMAPLPGFRIFPLSRRAVKGLEAVAKAAWVLCVAGIGGWIPRAALAISAAMLHGVQSGAVGSNHRWVIPTYTLAAMVFCESRGSPAESRGLSPTSIASSGFARQLTMLVSCFTFFAGGLSKLRESGWSWMDGRTIQYHLRRSCTGTVCQNAAAPFLARFLSNKLWMCRLMSIWTILFEIGCPVAALGIKPRIIMFLNAAAFHVGIALTMKPKFWPQMWCYLLCIPWERLFAGQSSQTHQRAIPRGGYAVATAVYTGLLGMLYLAWKVRAQTHSPDFLNINSANIVSFCFCRQGVEAWPYTSVPMYAVYKDLRREVYPQSRREIAAKRNWFACRVWPMAWASIKIDTWYPGTKRPRTTRSLFMALVEAGRLPLHTRTEYWRKLWQVVIAACRDKKSNLPKKYLEEFARWLAANPAVAGPGKHRLRLNLRLQLKPNLDSSAGRNIKIQDQNKPPLDVPSEKLKNCEQSGSVPTVTVSGAGVAEANGVYATVRKKNGSIKTRGGGAPLFIRKISKGKAGRQIKYSLSRATSTSTKERKWWLSLSKRASAGDKWSSDTDMYNVKSDGRVPPESGWVVLSAGSAPAPQISVQPSSDNHPIGKDSDAKLETRTEPSDSKSRSEPIKTYRWGVLAQCEVPTLV